MVRGNTEEALQCWLFVFSKLQVVAHRGVGVSSVIRSLIKSEMGGRSQFGVLQMKRMQNLIVLTAVEHFSEVC